MFAVLRAGEQQDLGLLGLCAPFGAGWNEPQPLSCWPEHIQALPWWKFPSQGLCRMRSSTAALPYNPQLALKFSVFKAQNPLKTPPQTLGVTPAALSCEHHSSFLCSTQNLLFFSFVLSPTPHLSWVKVTGNMPKDEPETENFGKTLKIDKVTAADEGTYQCTASNALGRARHDFHVHVEGAQYSLLKFGIKRVGMGSGGGSSLI